MSEAPREPHYTAERHLWGRRVILLNFKRFTKFTKSYIIVFMTRMIYLGFMNENEKGVHRRTPCFASSCNNTGREPREGFEFCALNVRLATHIRAFLCAESRKKQDDLVLIDETV